MSGESAKKPASAPARKPAEIEADIADTRDRLVGTIVELEDRVNPAKVANRGGQKVKAFYVGDDGVRWKNVAVTAGAVVGGLVAVHLLTSAVRWAVAAPPAKVVETDIVYLPVPRSRVGSAASLAIEA